MLMQVLALDGDGAVLMHMGSLATIGQRGPPNLRHIVFNNGTHDSVGGQPTHACSHDTFSITNIALACGYNEVSYGLVLCCFICSAWDGLFSFGCSGPCCLLECVCFVELELATS